jgi:peroxiredoxin
VKQINLNIKSCLLTAFLCITCLSVMAQVASGSGHSPDQNIKYLMPDSSVFPIEKLDSLKKAWGRVLFVHNKQDDANGIVHLMQMTNEIRHQLEEENSKRQQAMESMVNKLSPDFELADVLGKVWRLSELRGRIVVLNFWFTSCAPCVQEIPELNALVREYESKPVVFLAMTFNNTNQIRTFVKKHTFIYNLLPNSAEIDKKFHVSLWPTSIVIDKEGYIKLIVNTSPQIQEEMRRVMNSLI